MKFLIGVGWTACVLTLFGLFCAAILGTALAFTYVFGDWGIPMFAVGFLLVAGGVIHATGPDN